MKDDHKYWIWLTTKPKMNSYKIKKILQRFRTPENIYNATDKDISSMIGLESLDMVALADKSLEKAEKIMEEVERIGARIVTIDDYEYPPKLRYSEFPPYVLYTMGDIDWHSIKTMTVVGTRKCTEYGRYTAQSLCRSLVDAGFTIVSGMAGGIDGMAAKAAINAGGKTVAVLGSGIDVVYPAENADLYNSIVGGNGIVITEYPPGTKPLARNFPHRNRIMSALGDGVLVVEAPEKSGALITAKRAIDEGKNVFAVPGPIFKNEYKGTNLLIQQGAKLVMSAYDIASEYVFDRKELRTMRYELSNDIPLERNDFIDKPKENAPPKDNHNDTEGTKVEIDINDECFTELNDEEKKIIKLLADRSYGADEMCRCLDIKISELNNMLINLEMMGFISRIAGNSYKINR